MARREFTITKFRFDEEAGFYRARVTCAEESIEVDNEAGSWLGWRRKAKGSREFQRIGLPTWLCIALQDKLPMTQRKVNYMKRAA